MRLGTILLTLLLFRCGGDSLPAPSHPQSIAPDLGASAGAGNGTACAMDAACSSGFCRDGVCCDSDCGGGNKGDCVSCLGVETAYRGGVDGTCGTIPINNYICQHSADPTMQCEFDQACLGATTCPGRNYYPAGKSCGSAMACDGVGHCL